MDCQNFVVLTKHPKLNPLKFPDICFNPWLQRFHSEITWLLLLGPRDHYGGELVAEQSSVYYGRQEKEREMKEGIGRGNRRGEKEKEKGRQVGANNLFKVCTQ